VLSMFGTGAFHVAVEVLGLEYSYGYTEIGTGIFASPPGCCQRQSYRKSIPMGPSALKPDQIMKLIFHLQRAWPGRDYHLFRRNCCHFADEFCQQLGVGNAPSWLNNLAQAGARVLDVFNNLPSTAQVAHTAIAKATETDQQYMGGMLGLCVMPAGGLVDDFADVEEHLDVTDKAQPYAGQVFTVGKGNSAKHSLLCCAPSSESAEPREILEICI